MSLELLRIGAAILVTISSLLLLITVNWRGSIFLFGLTTFGVFLLLTNHWSPAMAVSQLVAGWMSGAVLALAMNSLPGAAQAEEEEGSPNPAPGFHPESHSALKPGRLFFLLAAIFIGSVLFSQLGEIPRWFPDLGPAPAWSGLVLIGFGLLKLGYTARVLPAFLGLLTSLSGFEILYASVQSSLLVAGLLAVIHLGLALAGAYLLVSPTDTLNYPAENST